MSDDGNDGADNVIPNALRILLFRKIRTFISFHFSYRTMTEFQRVTSLGGQTGNQWDGTGASRRQMAATSKSFIVCLMSRSEHLESVRSRWKGADENGA